MPINYQGSGGGVPRKTAHIFAKEAANNDITVFGSTLNNNTQYTTNIEDIQTYTPSGDTSSTFETGWRKAVISNKNYPLLGDMNGVLLTLSQQIAYILQHGLAQWDSATKYYTYDIVNVNGVLYISTIDNNTNNNPTGGTGWAVYYDPTSGFANIDLSNLSTYGNDRLHALKGYLDAGELLTDAEGLADVTKYAHSTFDISKFIIYANSSEISSPTLPLSNNGLFITADGIASGFAVGNVIKINSSINATNEIIIKERIIWASGSGQTLFSSYHSNNTEAFTCFTGSGDVSLRLNDDNSTILTVYFNANVGDVVDLYIQITASTLTLSVFVNGGTPKSDTRENPVVSFDLSDASYFVGSTYYGSYPTLGQIDLKELSIIKNGVIVFRGNKTEIDTIKPTDFTAHAYVHAQGTDYPNPALPFSEGSLVITNDGIASGFTANDYIKKSITFDTDTNFVIEGDFTTGNTTLEQGIFAFVTGVSGEQFGLSYYTNDKLIFWGGVGRYTFGSSLSYNTHYYYKVVCNGTVANVYLGTSKDNLTLDITDSNINNNIYNTLELGINTSANYNYPFFGSIDLNAFKIYVNGNLVYQPCLKIPYTLSKTGSKVVDVYARDRVNSMYEQFGSAPYYTLDEGVNFTIPQGELYGMKLDKITPHIVESVVDGSGNGYIVYSDNTCIQYGRKDVSFTSSSATFDVSLTKNYADATKYRAIATITGLAAITGNVVVYVTSFNTNKFTVSLDPESASGSHSCQVDWYTIGKI